MATVLIDKWNGGITNDPYDKDSTTCRITTGFDTITNGGLMTPYRSTESGDVNASTSKKKNFGIGLWTPTSAYRLFGLGVVSGTSRAEILMKDLTTGGSNDLSDTGWITPVNNSSSSGTAAFDLFIYYKQTGKFYGAQSGTHVWTFTPDGATAFDETHQALSYTNIGQGLIHSKDDILYIPYDNKIAKNNAGSWSPTALTLPNNLYITSICEYGNFLAIACAPLSGVGSSKVFLWDRDSSLATLSESIDWGQGNLKVLEEIDGYLVGVSMVGGIGGGSASIQDRIVFKYYAGGGAVKFKELMATTSSRLPIAKQKSNSRLYFLASMVINGTRREGLWSVGRSSIGSPFAVVHEKTPNNDTALTSGVLYNFILVDDYMFLSYETSGAIALAKTNDQATYSSTSIRETTINPKMGDADRNKIKQLKAVSLIYQPIPSGGQAVLKYKVDGGSYSTIFTETTTNTVSTEISFESDKGRNIEFRIESTGGVEIVEFRYKYDVLSGLL